MWKRMKEAGRVRGKRQGRVRGKRTGWVKEREGCIRGSKGALGREEGWMKGNGGAGGRGKCLYLQNWKKILKTYLTYFGEYGNEEEKIRDAVRLTLPD